MTCKHLIHIFEQTLKLKYMPKIEAKISKLRDDEKRDKNWYDVEIKTYKESISGKFEHWELRSLIQQIDNAIR